MTPVSDEAPPLLRLPLLGGLTRPVRLLGLAAGSAMILAIATLQPLLYPDLPITVLYILPVILVSWVGGVWLGIVAAVAASSAHLITGSAPGVVPSHPSVPYWNFLIGMLLYVVTAFILARLHRTLLHERELARTDSLTSLGNRRFFEDIARGELNRSRRHGRSFALAYVDVDRFKEINDARGHAEGDRLLRLVAEVLSGSLRESDVVARIGGDEFAVMLPETRADGARTAMEKGHERLTTTVNEAGYDVSFSIGVVIYQSGNELLAELLDRADRLMYAVKESGRGSIRFESDRVDNGARAAAGVGT